MTISTLERTPLAEIVSVFNQSFADYRIKIQFTESSLKQKIARENISLQYSVGAFDQGKLVGFILNGYDYLDQQRAVYNAGTGVVPSYRGQQLTKQLYDYLLPVFKKGKIDRGLLEVLDSNSTAIHIYLKLGYRINRDLTCYEGVVHFDKLPNIDQGILKVLSLLDWGQVSKYWNTLPTWQNSVGAIQRTQDDYKMVGVLIKEHLAGYGVVNP